MNSFVSDKMRRTSSAFVQKLEVVDSDVATGRKQKRNGLLKSQQTTKKIILSIADSDWWPLKLHTRKHTEALAPCMN